MPIYKSYADPLVINMVNYMNNIEHGFTFGCYEDTPDINFDNRFMKRLGALLIRRNPKNFLGEQSQDKGLN